MHTYLQLPETHRQLISKCIRLNSSCIPKKTYSNVSPQNIIKYSTRQNQNFVIFFDSSPMSNYFYEIALSSTTYFPSHCLIQPSTIFHLDPTHGFLNLDVTPDGSIVSRDHLFLAPLMSLYEVSWILHSQGSILHDLFIVQNDGGGKNLGDSYRAYYLPGIWCLVCSSTYHLSVISQALEMPKGQNAGPLGVYIQEGVERKQTKIKKKIQS